MRLTKNAIYVLRGNRTLWEAVRLALRVSRPTMYKYVTENSILLTTAAALEEFRKETGLPDCEILEMAPIKEVPMQS